MSQPRRLTNPGLLSLTSTFTRLFRLFAVCLLKSEVDPLRCVSSSNPYFIIARGFAVSKRENSLRRSLEGRFIV